MSPIELDEPTGRYLGPAEREVIALRLAAGWSLARIARELGRHPSTIGREVDRNGAVGTNLDRGPKYRARLAQHKAEQRARRPKPTKLQLNPALRAVVQVMLDGGCSPEQISGRLELDYPDELEMRMSHEAIYRSIYVQGRGELRRELRACHVVCVRA